MHLLPRAMVARTEAYPWRTQTIPPPPRAKVAQAEAYRPLRTQQMHPLPRVARTPQAAVEPQALQLASVHANLAVVLEPEALRLASVRANPPPVLDVTLGSSLSLGSARKGF